MAKIDTAQTLAPPLTAWGRLAANSTAHMVEHLFNAVIAVILPLITTSLGLSLSQERALASARTLMAGAASFPSEFCRRSCQPAKPFFRPLPWPDWPQLSRPERGFDFPFVDLHGAGGRRRRRISPTSVAIVCRVSGEARFCLGRAR